MVQEETMRLNSSSKPSLYSSRVSLSFFQGEQDCFEICTTFSLKTSLICGLDRRPLTAPWNKASSNVETVAANVGLLLMQIDFFRDTTVVAKTAQFKHRGHVLPQEFVELLPHLIVQRDGTLVLSSHNSRQVILTVDQLHNVLTRFVAWLPVAFNAPELTAFSMPPVPSALASLLIPKLASLDFNLEVNGWTRFVPDTACGAGYRAPTLFIDGEDAKSLPAGSIALFQDQPLFQFIDNSPGACIAPFCSGFDMPLGSQLLCAVHQDISFDTHTTPVISWNDTDGGVSGMLLQSPELVSVNCGVIAYMYQRCKTCHLLCTTLVSIGADKCNAPRSLVCPSCRYSPNADSLPMLALCSEADCLGKRATAWLVDHIVGFVLVCRNQNERIDYYKTVRAQEQINMKVPVQYGVENRSAADNEGWWPLTKPTCLERQQLEDIVKLLGITNELPFPSEAECASRATFLAAIMEAIPYRMSVTCELVSGQKINLFGDNSPPMHSVKYFMECRMQVLVELRDSVYSFMRKSPGFGYQRDKNTWDWIFRSRVNAMPFLYERQRRQRARRVMVLLGAAGPMAADSKLLDAEHARLSQAASVVNDTAVSLMDVGHCTTLEDSVLRAVQLQELLQRVESAVATKVERLRDCKRATKLSLVLSPTSKNRVDRIQNQRLCEGIGNLPLADPAQKYAKGDKAFVASAARNKMLFLDAALDIDKEHDNEARNVSRALKPVNARLATIVRRVQGMQDDQKALDRFVRDVQALAIPWRISEEHIYGRLHGVESGLSVLYAMVRKLGWHLMAGKAAPWLIFAADDEEANNQMARSHLFNKTHQRLPLNLLEGRGMARVIALSVLFMMSESTDTVLGSEAVAIIKIVAEQEKKTQNCSLEKISPFSTVVDNTDRLQMVKGFLLRCPSVRPLDIVSVPASDLIILLREPRRFDLDMACDVTASVRWKLSRKDEGKGSFGPKTLGLFWMKRKKQVSLDSQIVCRSLLQSMGIDARVYTAKGPECSAAIATLLLRNHAIITEADLQCKRYLAKGFFNIRTEEDEKPLKIDFDPNNGRFGTKVCSTTGSMSLVGQGITEEEVRQSPEGAFLMGLSRLNDKITPPDLLTAADVTASRALSVLCSNSRDSHLAALPDMARYIAGVEVARVDLGEPCIVTPRDVEYYVPGMISTHFGVGVQKEEDNNFRVAYRYQEINSPKADIRICVPDFRVLMSSTSVTSLKQPPQILATDGKIHIVVDKKIHIVTYASLLDGKPRSIFLGKVFSNALNAIVSGANKTHGMAALFLLETACFSGNLRLFPKKLAMARLAVKRLRTFVVGQTKTATRGRTVLMLRKATDGDDDISYLRYDVMGGLPRLELLLSMAELAVRTKGTLDSMLN
jgi:hypothetical protein